MKCISEATLNDGLRDLKPIPRVIELDRKQPEFTLTFDDYMKRVVTQIRIRKARERYTKHADLLKRVSERWRAAPLYRCIVGHQIRFWRVTVDDVFRTRPWHMTAAEAHFPLQLMNALLDQGHIVAKRMKGSWAGAMGQVQFASSFLSFAVISTLVRTEIYGKPQMYSVRLPTMPSLDGTVSQTWGRRVELRRV